MKTGVWAVIVGSALLVCSGCGDDDDDAADGDADSDGDADGDGDADSDGDADGDADSDGDVDGDGDADSDGDVDGDGDADSDGDADADADCTSQPAGVDCGGEGPGCPDGFPFMCFGGEGDCYVTDEDCEACCGFSCGAPPCVGGF